MSSLRCVSAAAIAAVGVVLCCATAGLGGEKVGEATLIKTAVTGSQGPLWVSAPVHRDERIRTSNTGLGQFLFRDGTKLAVGWGSSVVIDKFVFDDDASMKKLTIKAAKGTFRWISGNSKSTAYQIVTPAGTIGVRGTAFDFYVGADGTTAVVLLRGAASFCGAGGCKQLERRCDCIVAKPRGRVSDPGRVDAAIFKTLGNKRALSFLSGNQQLSGSFGGSGCGLGLAALEEPAKVAPRAAPAQAPSRPDKSKRADKPEQPATTAQPSKPDAPARDRHKNTRGAGHAKGVGEGHHEKGTGPGYSKR